MPEATEAGFREWVLRCRPSLRSTAYLLCGDWFLADDLVQEASARVYAKWKRIATGSPDSYARKVLVNLVIDHSRRPARREEPSAKIPDRVGASPLGEGLRDQLVAALLEVPPGQRAVLVLRFWEDLSIEQTAAALGTSTGNVKSQTSRGLAALRESCARHGVSIGVSEHKEVL